MGDPGRKMDFKLDTDVEYTGRRIDVTELGAWILSNNATLSWLG
jgi:hypothetical protein